MKNKLTIIAAFLVVQLSHAQTVQNALLWKLEGKDIETSYILGTMHVLCDASLTPNVEKALYATDVVVLEIDMDSPTLQTEMMQGIMLPEGESISKYLTVEESKTLDEYLNTQIKMQLSMVDKMVPLMVESLLIPSMLDCPMQSIENNLMAHAQREEEEVMGLEAVQDQFNAFNEIPLKEQVLSLLKKAYDNGKLDKAVFKRMQDAYMKHDLNALMLIMKEESSNFMENSNALLDNRNQKWIPRILSIAQKQSAFYGVGAAHLAGERGVINLLRTQGYVLTPILAD
ncbi:TraB/GumN family protein [Nonlabens antarcticus]|uniref:TraB/GumN family protein n=1 Tax=Nonlabens antarcticus TaxID=392714 RepID=UPI001890EE1B|nr:TraB/GumN family protein [Nonlabens antarcticus]